MRRLITGVGALGSALALSGIVTAFACTQAPTMDLSQSFGAPDQTVLVTGASWGVHDPVAVHWDSLSNSVIASGVSDAQGTLGPIAVRLPKNAEPGYHFLALSANVGIPGVSGAVMRTPVQVVAAGSSSARVPSTGLPAIPATSSPGVGLGAAAILAAAGVAGLLLLGTGGAMLVRGSRRIPARVTLRRP